MLQSLKYRKHELTLLKQRELLSAKLENNTEEADNFDNLGLPLFSEKIAEHNYSELIPAKLEILQVNLGYLCNQSCSHCHVDAGPDRKELMSLETLDLCLDLARKHAIPTIDITGGAPEMHPHFCYFVSQAHKQGVKEIIVRSNLTILVSHSKYEDMPKFFRDNQVRVVSSLPCYTAENTDKQRGDGVFEKSIAALKKLNAIGYGMAGSKLCLDLVYNPGGPFLAGEQSQLESDYKRELNDNFGIQFNSLFALNNLPINRFLEFLLKNGHYNKYMQTLVSAFNPATLSGLMCRNTISIDYQGYLYDCDFNQMLEMSIKDSSQKAIHIKDFNLEYLANRKILTAQHCYGCTAGAGSSCQGSVV